MQDFNLYFKYNLYFLNKYLFFIVLLFNTTFALDVSANDSFVGTSSKIKLVSDSNESLSFYLLHPSKKIFPIANLQGVSSSSTNLQIPSIYLMKEGTYQLLVYNEEMVLLASDDFFVVSDAVGGNVEINPDNKFELLEFPTTINLLEPVSFTLRALDDNLELFPGYSGTVKFEVIGDPNATLPTNYQFELSDGGEHLFADSLVFTQSGSHKFVITDVDDESIRAEFDVLVLESQTEFESPVEIVVNEPVNNSISQTSQISFKGSTGVGLDIQLFENDVLLETFTADSDGNFDFMSPALSDGDYKFNLVVNNVKSDDINVKINTGTVSLDSFDLSKDELISSEIFDVSASVSAELTSASIVISGLKTPLLIDGKDISGQVAAPLLPGEYELLLILTDEFGVSSNFKIDKKITVSESDNSVIGDDDLDVPNDVFESPSNEVILDPNLPTPNAVTGLTAIVSDKMVTLKFNHSSDDTGIAFYEIRYGESIDNLNLFVETKGPINEWFIPELDNDVEYFFQVFAVDLDGNTGEGSDIISAIAGRPDSTSLFGSQVNDDVIRSDVGPSLYLSIFISLIFFVLFHFNVLKFNK